MNTNDESFELLSVRYSALLFIAGDVCIITAVTASHHTNTLQPVSVGL